MTGNSFSSFGLTKAEQTELSSPFDTMIFGIWKHGVVDHWEASGKQELAEAGIDMIYRRNWQLERLGYQHTNQSTDGHVRVYLGPTRGGQPDIRIDMEIGDRNADELLATMECIVGSENVPHIRVLRLDAKVDLPMDVYDVRKRLWRRGWPKLINYDKQENGNPDTDFKGTPGTIYFGNRGEKSKVTLYDKVKNAKSKGHDDIYSKLETCCRIEKKIIRDKHYRFIQFLEVGAEKYNPFRDLILGNIEGLGRQLRYNIGLHNYMVQLKLAVDNEPDEKKQKALKKKSDAVRRRVKKGAVYLEQEWKKRYLYWVATLPDLRKMYPEEYLDDDDDFIRPEDYWADFDPRELEV